MTEMPVVPKKDRLSPPIMLAFRNAYDARDGRKKLDLRDESGERVIASRRTSGRTPISESLLRREVAHDLEVLLNTVALESTDDLANFERVRASILNFGFPDIAHRSIDEISVEDLKDEITSVLMTYEPRLERNSIRARRDNSIGKEELKLRFVVHADLHCEPLNVPIEFIADVDLDSGNIQVSRL
jgi:type VI secretion system protein ImpF